jgi:serine/threonine protein kinase
MLVELWDAVDAKRGTPRSVRILSNEALSHREAFVAAANLQRDLIHPNRVQVVDVIEVEGRPAVVTEQVVGPSLATWRRIRTRSPEEVLEAFRDVVRGVGAAHQVGLLHLGLTTSQIWMSNRRGSFIPKVELAFGPIELAGLHMGNGRAPEHAQGQPPDARADMFLLGCIVYEMLTGQPPFDHSLNKRPGQAVASSHRPVAEMRPGLPEPIVQIVESLLVSDPAKRMGSTNELLAAIVAASEPQQDTQPSPPPPVQSHERDLPSYARMKTPKPKPEPEPQTEPAAPPDRVQRPQLSLVTVVSMVMAAVSTGLLIWKSF